MKRIKSFLETRKGWILVLTGAGILFDIFILDPTWDLVILLLSGLWILSIWLYRLEGRISIIGGLIFLAFCPLLLIFGKETISGKSAIWAYIFLMIGAGQAFAEYLEEKRKRAKKKR